MDERDAMNIETVATLNAGTATLVQIALTAARAAIVALNELEVIESNKTDRNRAMLGAIWDLQRAVMVAGQ